MAKKLHNIADLILALPVGVSFWYKPMHEALIIDIVFTLANNKPWKRRGNKRFLQMDSQICGMWDSFEGATGRILRKYFSSQTQQ